MKKMIFTGMFLFCAISSVYSEVWVSKQIVTFPRSGMIQDEKISDDLKLFDVFKANDFIVCKSNGFFNMTETIEKNHMIYYDYKNSDTELIYNDYYIYDNKYIFNLYDFNINTVNFHKNSSDSLWITHYIADSSGSYFSKFNKAGGLLFTKKFDNIYLTDWKNNDRGIILGEGLFITSNSGYEWKALISDIESELQGYNVADCKLTDDYIYMQANHKTENQSAIFRYRLSDSIIDFFRFDSDLLYNNIEIIDDEIYILGGKSRDILNTYYKFNIKKFNPLTEEFETILDIKSQSELTHLLKRNDTIRAFATKDLFYAEYQNEWKLQEQLNNEARIRFDNKNFREEEVRISFDSVYIIDNKTIYLLSEKKTTGVKSNTEPSISISPNPAGDYIEISIGSQRDSKGACPLVNKFEIYDVLGKSVMVEQTSSSFHSGGTPELLRIDISHLPRGVYFVRIGDKVEKFIKM